MSTAGLAEELRLVEEDLTRLRETAADLRRRIGDRDEEPTDQLEARREELLTRLGQPVRTNGS
jgi:hypothetical protein